MIARAFKTCAAVAGLLALAACAKTEKISNVEPSGFLPKSVYGKMEPGKGEMAPALMYRAPNADFAKYNKVLLDPIVGFAPPGEAGDLNPQNKQALLNNFYTLLVQELEQDYPLVIGPEPGTLRIQIAVVKATKKNVTMDTVSTLMPIGLAARNLTSYVTGEPTFTGRLRIEYEVTDAMTGEILAAGIDERAGGTQLSEGQLDSWDSVNAAMDFYAALFRYRLCVARGAPDCTRPQTF